MQLRTAQIHWLILHLTSQLLLRLSKLEVEALLPETGAEIAAAGNVDVVFPAAGEVAVAPAFES